MIKVFLLIILVFFSGYYSFSQDSTSNKQIISSYKFDLTSFSGPYNTHNKEIPESEKDLQFFDDCNKLKPLSDTSFILTHSDGRDALLYKNIKTIKFITQKNKFWDGVWLGALIGAGFGLLVSLTHESKNPDDSKETNTLTAVAIGVPVSALLGSITGGIIGALTKEKIVFDLSQYRPDSRKEQALSIFLKYQKK